LVAFIFQGIHTICNTIVLISTHFEHPGNFLIDFRNADYTTLEFQNLTTAHHRTRIMHLKNVFDSNSKMIGSFSILSGISFVVVSQDIFKEIKVI
jgi:hypothetical protein